MLSSNMLKEIRLSEKIPNSTQIKSYVESSLSSYVQLSAIQSAIQEAVDKYIVTKFEVFPTSAEISAGTIDSFEGLQSICGWSEDDKKDEMNFTGFEYTEKVASCDIFTALIRSSTLKEDTNLIIDFGDGTEQIRLKDYVLSEDEKKLSNPGILDKGKTFIHYPSELTDGEVEIRICHRYEKSKKYIVTIYGNAYWGLRSNNISINSKTTQTIISRLFDADLPFATCIYNISSIANGSNKILKILLPNYKDVSNWTNTSNAFQNCKNLISVMGFSTDTENPNKTKRVFLFKSRIYASGGMFSGCKNLTECDIVLPAGSIANSVCDNFYSGCSKLSTDILMLLPKSGFSNMFMAFSGVFNNCSSLTCSDISKLEKILWNNKFVEWSSTNTALNGCTTIGLNNIPKSWGGNKA